MNLPGPPWGVSSDMYLALLSNSGEEISSDEQGKVLSVDAIGRKEDGLRRLDLFTPKRTHPQGVNGDGSVVDMVSVWSH